MRILLLFLALLVSGLAQVPTPSPPLVIPDPIAGPPREPVELRWNLDESTYPVNAGIQVGAKVRGTMVLPATDPGRTQLHVELLLPLVSRNGRTVLLPAGTQLVAQVFRLNDQFRFVGFQSLLLPSGKSYSIYEDVFRLGPGHLISTQEGTPVMVTVSRPLRMEAFGPAR